MNKPQKPADALFPALLRGSIAGRSLVAFILIMLVVFPVQGEEFYYKYREGDQYRILSTITEDVFVDREASHSAEIINRIAVEVTGVSGESGRFRAAFQTAEKAALTGGGAAFSWSRAYSSEFSRDRLGYLTIDDMFYMPVVRNVPVFPGRDLNPGDSWSADGYEVHDFRDGFGIAEPYRIPFTADYVFLGNREWKGKTYPAFSVSYRIFYDAPRVSGRIWPSRIQGASRQVVYWDRERGMAPAYEEDFRMIITLSDGRSVEYRGKAEAEVIEAPVMDKEAIAEEIIGDIRRLDIEGATVRIEEAGVTINLENIQFLPDSALLTPGEKLKLDKLVEILSHYPERDILVSGHTALAGTFEMRAALSLERARGVADYLLEKNTRSRERIMVQGFGAERPLADNDTEGGRRRNRRVEITILEN